MTHSPFLISLPVADRPRAHAFYRDGLGLQAIGPPADDGVPEPLLFVLNDQTRLMLIPTGGFGWVIGDHEVARSGVSEGPLGIWRSRRRRGGGDRRAGPPGRGDGRRRAGTAAWGYAAAFADPDGHVWTVTSAPLPA